MEAITELLQQLNINDIDELTNSFDKITIHDDKFILEKNNKNIIIYRKHKCCLEYKTKINYIPYIH